MGPEKGYRDIGAALQTLGLDLMSAIQAT